jgi:hypothetical protein
MPCPVRSADRLDGNHLAPPLQALARIGAVGHLAGQLAAGGVDVVAARLADGGHHAGVLQHRANASTRSRGERFRPDCGNGLNGIRLILQGMRKPGTAAGRGR